MNTKIYVAVTATFDENGRITPTEPVWEYGRRYIIDKVVDVRQAPALKAGGGSDRYTIIINVRQSYLFFERTSNLTGNVIGRCVI